MPAAKDRRVAALADQPMADVSTKAGERADDCAEMIVADATDRHRAAWGIGAPTHAPHEGRGKVRSLRVSPGERRRVSRR
jgi:hypothetical protein